MGIRHRDDGRGGLRLGGRDTYRIEIAPGEDDALVLALAVFVDEPARLR